MLVTLMKQSMDDLPNFDPSAALQCFPNCNPYGLLSSTDFEALESWGEGTLNALEVQNWYS